MYIDIGIDFSPVPAGRVRSDGPDSGERFREDFLRPAIEQKGPIEIRIDTTAGYQSSFLEEAFGGCIRKGYITPDGFLARLKIVSDSSDFDLWQDLILYYIKNAKLPTDAKSSN